MISRNVRTLILAALLLVIASAPAMACGQTGEPPCRAPEQPIIVIFDDVVIGPGIFNIPIWWYYWPW